MSELALHIFLPAARPNQYRLPVPPGQETNKAASAAVCLFVCLGLCVLSSYIVYL